MIKTETFDVKLEKRSLNGLMWNDKHNLTTGVLPVKLQDAKLLLKNTNYTEHSVLGLTVIMF